MLITLKKMLRTAASAAVSAALICTFLPLSAAAEEDIPYVTTVYNERNGLPTGEANAVLQTDDGYIWIGSYGGLIRYDGTAFRNYSMEEDGISSCSVRAIFQDSTGRLWIGTNDAGVFVLAEGVFSHITSPEDGSFLCIRDFDEDYSGRIYAASNSGICEIKGGNIIPCTDESVFGNVVYSVAADRFGRVWGVMNSGKCAVVRNGKLVDMLSSDKFFSDAEIYCSDADDEGNIVLATAGNRVAVLKFGSESDYDITYYDTGAASTHNSVKAENGKILVSGLKGFALIGADGSVREFGEREKAMSVNCAAEDYEGNIWLATSSYGVIKYSRGCFGTPNAAAELDGVTVNAVAEADGVRYIGTDTGLLICGKNWKRTENELTEMFDGIRIRHIIADKSGNIWIGSYSEYAATRYSPKSGDITVFNSENGLIGDRVRVLRELKDGGIAVGTQTGVSIIRNGEAAESYGSEQGMANTSILCFEETEDAILAGTDGGGICALKDGTVTNYGAAEGLGEGVVLRMLKDTKGEGYFVSAGSSLYYWNDRGFTKLTNFIKTAGSIFDFYDRDGKLWFMQNNGVFAVDKEWLLSGAKGFATLEYSFSCGLTGSLNANTWHWLDDNGNLLIATRNGISVFGFKGVENVPPKAVINSVSVDDTVYERPSVIEVESGATRITIDFAALSYSDTSRLKIFYRLTDFDSDFIPIENEKSGTVSYTNLPGGSYTFELKITAYDNNGNPGGGDTVSFTIVKEKKLAENPLFWVITVLLFILVCFLGTVIYSRIKLSRIRRRQQEYKQIIEHALLCFAKAIDAKDRYTNGHSLRVAAYSRELAKRMGLTEEEQENIYYVALLHDIGKIGIPDSILGKPERLTADEEEVMKKHPDIGGDILKDFDALAGIADGAKYHHERYDGEGYCTGLAGEDIPKVARIVGVADAYDAMASDRCYRKALAPDVIEEELKKSAGTQYDPEVVPHMLAMIEEGAVPINAEGIIFF